MTKCLNCGLEVHPIPGKRARLYCSVNCRVSHFHKRKAEKRVREKTEGVLKEGFYSVEAYRKLEEENKALREELAKLKGDKVIAQANVAFGPTGEELQPGQKVTIPESWCKNNYAPYKTFNEILSLAKGGASRLEVESAIDLCPKLTAPQIQMIRAKINQQQ